MGKIFSKGSSPDLSAAATQQGIENRDTALASWQLNNANQITPWGTKTTTQTGPKDTDYTITTALNGTDQANLDKTRGIQSGLLDLAPNALENVYNHLGQDVNTGNLPPMAYQVDARGSKNLDYSNLPGAQYGVGSTDAIRQQMEDAAWGKYIDRAQPLQQQQTDQLNTRIANMGGVTTGAGAGKMQSQLMASQGDQNRQAIFDSILQGGNAAQQEQNMRLAGANLWNTSREGDANLLNQQTGFNNAVNQQDVQNAFANANLTNATRQQGLNENAQLRQMPLNELMAMLSGTQVQSPQFQQINPTNIQPAPIYNAAAAQNQNNADSSNAWLGAAAKIGAAAISDRRLKSDIVQIGTTPKGLPWYEYTLFGKKEQGVMADEVQKVRPDAVIEHPDGYLMVDYSKVE